MKKKILGIVLLLTLCLTSCMGVLYPTTDQKEPSVVQVSNEISELYDKISTGCVGIYGKNGEQGSIGSGVVYKENNGTYYVVTNNHVIKDMKELKIYRGGSKYYRASVVGTDVHNDLAVLTFTLDLFGGSEVYIHDIFSYDEEIVKVGQTAIAIGCPLGLENFNTLTTGVVSRVTRNEIQTNAEINPGNSGGGLFNLAGRLIGINTEKKTYTTATNEDGSVSQIPVEGVSFAIPLSIIKNSINDIERFGTDISRPKLGITVTAINRYISEYDYTKHLPNTSEAGVIVVDAGDGVAKQAGIKVSDIILKMNDVEVYSLEELSYVMSQVNVGDTLKLEIYRSSTGQVQTINVTLK